jgi:uncharacterized repeat protein (TIGR03803 family)
MSRGKLPIGLTVLLATLAMTALVIATPAAAQEEKVLHSFNNGASGGSYPYSGLILDKAGNLYGTTGFGGTGTGCYSGCGTVFELMPQAGGGWVEKVLHNFQLNVTGGVQPVSGLIFDAAGNLYGTTAAGGNTTCIGGCGTVFELIPDGGGGWTEKVLHSFGGSPEGAFPQGGLIFDAAGNLYGTTYEGGPRGGCQCGTVFELSPLPGGGWKEKILHIFGRTGPGFPSSSLIFDDDGNLFGMALGGSGSGCIGVYGCGTVFELSPVAGGGWSEQVLHNFTKNGTDGNVPYGGLISDAAGNLYGTTSAGGAGLCGDGRGIEVGCGTVFELIKPGIPGGEWAEAILYAFEGNGSLDPAPTAGLIFDAAGNLYGTTYGGGAYQGINGGLGTVFKLSPAADGIWTETTLHSFGNGNDGAFPLAGLIFDTAGNLYGTTSWGGINGPDSGTVFEIMP